MFPLRDADSPHHRRRAQQLFLSALPARSANSFQSNGKPPRSAHSPSKEINQQRSSQSEKSGIKKASVIHLLPQDQRHGCWASDSRRMGIQYDAGASAPGTSTGGGGGQGLAGSILASGEPRETSNPERTHEALGTTMIQGLEAKGDLWTTVIPTGHAGNDSPIKTTQESWRAPGFPFPLRDIYEDPRMGKRTREVVSLTIGEPDLSLFQTPEGYEVVNEEMHEVPCKQ